MQSSHPVRLNKFISNTGLCSRREADKLIDEHQVKINGRLADTGMQVRDGDQVTVRGKLLKPKPKAVYLAYNKPVGITCTTDRQIIGNIVDAVNYRGRIFPVGRLDKASEGLIFLTNDGDIVNKILRAGNAHEKEYIVSVDKPVSDGFIKKMAAGVPILGTVTQPCKVRQISANSFNIVLTQGLNRQIRRMAEFLGYNVTKLKRIRIMNVRLNDLPTGQWRELNSAEMQTIENLLQHSDKTEAASIGSNAKPATKKSAPRAATSGKAAAKKPAVKTPAANSKGYKKDKPQTQVKGRSEKTGGRQGRQKTPPRKIR